VRKGWTRDDSLRMAYIVAIGQFIRELYKESEDMPEHLKRLLAQLDASDERVDEPS
jgi:hypothetical protein